ncbi:hypothetical protein BYT27DRAFT_7166087 [Phlegmacium glaucopus]|nr:hypothetical protein BYT27DRAFT_7166087 [Phlegmacium glaucopus]
MWFGNKAEGQGVVFASPRNSLDKPQKRAFPSAYSTPHDAILADLISSPERVASPEPDVNLLSKNVSPTPSQHPYHPSRLPSPDFLLDPFDGTSLGTLLPCSQDSEVQPDQHSPSQINLSSPEVGSTQSANAAVPSELVWSHLTNILDLQSQISKMHIEMESIGSGKAADVKNKKHVFSHKTTLSNVSTTGVDTGSKRAGPEDMPVPPGLSSMEPEGDEENVDVPSEEAEKNKAREEEFASLAHQFEGRKQAIGDIMGKLDDLFNVLSEFHALQAPSLDLPATRQSSLPVTPPMNNLSPPVVADSDIRTRMPSTQASTSTRPHELTHPQRASSSSAVSPPPISRTQSDNVFLEAAPRKMAPLKKPLPPTLLVNSMDPASEGNTQNSAPSTPGSSKLED